MQIGKFNNLEELSSMK